MKFKNSFNLLLLIMAGGMTVIQSFAEVKGGISQVDFSNFPEFSAYVVVEDDQGNFVQGIMPTDVSVVEDGVLVTVSGVETVASVGDKTAPAMSIVLGIDNSASMLGREEELERATSAFLDNLNPHDRIAVVQFSRGRNAELWEMRFTEDKKRAKARTRLGALSAKTYLYDMIWRSADLLEEESLLGRRTIVIFSDGEDRGSQRSLAQAIQRVKEVEAPVFPIELTPKSRSRNQELISLAEQTGGRYFHSPNPEELVGLYEEIARQLVKQYRVTYVSDNASLKNPERKIQVTVRVGSDAFTTQKTILLDPDKVKVAMAVYDGSKEDLLGLLDQFPNSQWTDDITYKLGQVYEEEGDLDGALQYYETLISSFPESQWSDDAHFRLASAYLKGGNDAQALSAFQQLADKFPNSEWADDVLFQSGQIYAQRGDVTQAQKFLDDLVDKYPDSEWIDDAQFGFGEAYVQAGDYDRAVVAYQRVIETSPDSELADDALFEIGSIYAQQREWEKAEGHLAPFQNEHLASEQAPEALLALGEVYAEQGMPARAETVYELLRANFPGHEATARIPERPLVLRSVNLMVSKKEYSMNKGVDYVVQRGDSFSTLAQRFLGDANQWSRLYELNKDTIKNPDLIFAGLKIRIVYGE
jgi:VWFA-related protein